MLDLIHYAALVFVWPAVALHELTHYLAARRVADGVRIQIVAERPQTTVDRWRRDVGLGIILVAYAPLLAGLAGGAALLVWAVTSGVPAPETVRDWAVVALGAGWYAVYIAPSMDDVATAQTGVERVVE